MIETKSMQERNVIFLSVRLTFCHIKIGLAADKWLNINVLQG
jgi:hypothetical protein